MWMDRHGWTESRLMSETYWIRTDKQAGLQTIDINFQFTFARNKDISVWYTASDRNISVTRNTKSANRTRKRNTRHDRQHHNRIHSVHNFVTLTLTRQLRKRSKVKLLSWVINSPPPVTTWSKGTTAFTLDLCYRWTASRSGRFKPVRHRMGGSVGHRAGLDGLENQEFSSVRTHWTLLGEKAKTGGEIQALRWNRPAWEECGPCPVFACYAMTFVLQQRKKAGKKTSVRVVGKCQFGTIQCFDMSMTEQQVFAFYIHCA
jgi:hypothetical protein